MSKRTRNAAHDREHAPQNIVIAPLSIHANLLPAEFYQARREAKVLGYLVLGVILLAVLGVLASAGTYVMAQGTAAQLSTEQQRGAQIRSQESKYAVVTSTNSEITLAKAAQQIAVSDESDLARISDQFWTGMPAKTGLTSLEISEPALDAKSSSTSGGTSSSTTPDPLGSDGSVVTISFTVTNGAFVQAADIIDGLSRSLTGYQQARVTSIASSTSGGGYTYTGAVVLDIQAVGTDRAGAVDAQQLKADRDQLSKSGLATLSTGSGN